MVLQLLQQLQAIQPRHADIADHYARPVRRQSRRQAAGVVQAEHAQPGEIEGLAQRLAQVGIVVDQQHLGLGIDLTHAVQSSLGKVTPGSALRR